MASCEVFGQSLIKLIEDNNHSKPADFSAECDKSCQTGAIEEQNFLNLGICTIAIPPPSFLPF